MKCKWHLCENEIEGNRKKYCSHNCKNKYNVDKRRRKTKRLIVDYKGGKCEHCGYDKSNYALQFHHINPKEKDFNIASGNTRSLDEMKAEADKCLLLCANCHAEEHERLDNLNKGREA